MMKTQFLNIFILISVLLNTGYLQKSLATIRYLSLQESFKFIALQFTQVSLINLISSN